MQSTYSPYQRRLLAIAMAFPTLGALIGIAGAFRWLDMQTLVPVIVLMDIALVAFLLSQATRRAESATVETD